MARKKKLDPLALASLTLVGLGMVLCVIDDVRCRFIEQEGLLTGLGSLFVLVGVLFGLIGFPILLLRKRLAGNYIFLTVAIFLGFMVIMDEISNVFKHDIRPRISRFRADARSMATALEGYFVEQGKYPAWGRGRQGINRFAPKDSGAYRMHTFRHWSTSEEQKTLALLTTPIPYITSIPDDLFADTRGASMGYYSDENGWILFSWGPDTDENKPDEWDLEPDIEKVYRSDVAQPSWTLICGHSSAPKHEAYTYDPTNGTISPGDIWRVKQ